MQTGPKNLITDVPGLMVGNAQDDALKSGTTVLTSDKPFTAAVHVMGGAPGTRETDLLAPDKTVQQVDALVLSGGSAFGLDAASGVADTLRKMGRGFQVVDQTVPIVPAAILFDLINGGDKNWTENPYRALGEQALLAASDIFELGSHGAGTGATTASFKGGLGSASILLPSGHTVGALVAVNALGDAVVPDTPHFWAAPWELDDEFGGHGIVSKPTTDWPKTKLSAKNTTIAIVATDADLSQAQCTRMATAAHDGMARALVPSHTPMDGDLVFAASTNAKPILDDIQDPIFLGHAAATCLARAIARGVYSATAISGDLLPAYTDIHRKPR
ncbi:P1 family peptidase [Cognatishimia activa]|uniref:L-aminopeptidase/D-esterase n=1 Tax=Cognatishimia activa TaxID=1715691 RepID=A0A0P1IUZ1_9RHOB|nr:P1 family peptidase [Cognatishimia activa]CUI49981.1 L-aminopeptidase/D-esterase [Cognatishimia activa]CUK27372.1 L-aminopeptidase/D-esterase [Cognatishimia activa]